jgi:hypothetical protein
MAMNIKDANLIPAGYEQTADLSTVQTLTVPANARAALIQAVDNDVSWRDDGTNAAVSAGGTAGGMILAAGETFVYVGKLEAFTAIEAVSASTAYLNVSYYK